jgi:hypothetical protein
MPLPPLPAGGGEAAGRTEADAGEATGGLGADGAVGAEGMAGAAGVEGVVAAGRGMPQLVRVDVLQGRHGGQAG